MTTEETTPKKKAGGARPGSGRKPIPLKERKLQRAWYLNEEEYKKVNAFVKRMRAGKE